MLAQWQNGTLQVVDPQAAATTKTVIFPKPGWNS
jgi:branched-chain amino acid transport system substrate-binding protein